MKRTLALAIALAGLMLASPSFAAEPPAAPAPSGSSAAGGDSSPPTSPTSPSAPKTATAPTRTVRGRVLIDCEHGKANDVVTLDADVAKSAEAGGQVDTNKAAVAYAMTLPQNQPDPAG